MKAIIIAAGTGTRLYPITKDIPKSLVDVGQGLTLLETQLHSLKECGIKDIVMIIGYRADQIESKLEEYRSDFNIEIVFNPFFEGSNNLMSVWMARHFFSDEFITINGDDIFDASIIRELMKSTHPITMITDIKDQYDEDDMKIISADGLVKRVSKKVPIEEANGESVGIIKFCGSGPGIYADMLESMVRDPENLNVFYLKAIQNIIDAGHDVHFSQCNPSDWGEIDFHPDLEMIRQYVSQTNLVERILDKS
ncbi:MAG: phosphocholine cytidylyltransferase family protein [Candidatus Marinimicrobia bacterium]|nr:phosphocholine cytidylyltransferase family protein [Candidatus Neomarinimicrobiota bacterium]MBT3680053.1 phosphocholine cytidylyltransferase family protein [Candidatus Neomarinimicrobiota bacterium]MBT3950038.1 phosphocholine cytidylyltransferase family protein [Candidatus Neomarinimicrobiota bacterium]MBT4295806.1 phosphocholine cytidylyltransferase family protein [Candidatus Neomarinimicrobiota bacterium]MBT4480327.1 phosphocholine cytidylyltransferase family protein [Candidatus Neomarini